MARNARATKQVLQQRREQVLELLAGGPRSTQDIAFHLELSYPQTTLMLSKIEETNDIERLPGRQSRKLFYQLSSGRAKAMAEILDPIIDNVGTEICLANIDGKLFVCYESLANFAETTPYEVVYSELVSLLSDDGLI